MVYLLKIKNEYAIASFVFAISIFLFYLPVTASNYSNFPILSDPTSVQSNFTRDYGCVSNCAPYFHMIDTGADGDQIFPLIKLATTQISKGIIPLWNPYLGTGIPLAADSTNYVFSPLFEFYNIPTFLWDIPILITVWLAGFFTFLYLRIWKLSIPSCLIGGLFFMFSGTFTWYLPHTSVMVTVFTPLILFSIEKIIRSNNPKYLILGSASIAMALLGAHLESILLQILFCSLYLFFRILYMTFSKYSKQSNLDLVIQNGTILTQTKKKIIASCFVILIAGIGLSSFLMLPTYEYIKNSGPLDHSSTIGLSYIPYTFTGITPFIPYFLGHIHGYFVDLGKDGSYHMWDLLGSYVGVSCLFLSLFGIISSRKLDHSHKRIVQFFFGISIFFLLKSYGVPIANWLGALPLYNSIVFPRYDGFIWSLGFAISAAFGIDALLKQKIEPMKILITSMMVSGTLVVLSLTALPYLTSLNSFLYVLFQISEALFFILVLSLTCISIRRDKKNIISVLSTVFLELSLYIPMGLSPIWQFDRSLVVIGGLAAICLVSFLPRRFILNNKIDLKLWLIISLIGITFAGQLIVYFESPIGLPLKRDIYEQNPLTNFLKTHLDNSRIFSPDYQFRPNFPASYEINTIGIMTAFNVDSSRSFISNFLDPAAQYHIFDYISSWRDQNAPPLIEEYHVNEKYYDFLGVKYIVAENTNPNQEKNFEFENAWQRIGINRNINQTFVPNVENITSIAIQLGTYDKINHGKVILNLDSIPYKQQFHRQSEINASEIVNGGFNEFKIKPIENVPGIQFSLELSYPESDENNAIAVGIYNPHNNSVLSSSNYSKEQLYVDGNIIGGSIVMDVYSNNKFPLVFSYHGLNVYESKNAFPRAFLVNKFLEANSYDEAQNLIKRSGFDLRNKVVLETHLGRNQVDSLNYTINENSTAKIISYSSNEVKVTTNSKSASMLILTDTYYPGWKSFVDGTESPIYRADGLVRAVFVPAGNHTVEFRYLPSSFTIGFSISLATTFGLLAYFFIQKRKQKIMHPNQMRIKVST